MKKHLFSLVIVGSLLCNTLAVGMDKSENSVGPNNGRKNDPLNDVRWSHGGGLFNAAIALPSALATYCYYSAQKETLLVLTGLLLYVLYKSDTVRSVLRKYVMHDKTINTLDTVDKKDNSKKNKIKTHLIDLSDAIFGFEEEIITQVEEDIMGLVQTVTEQLEVDVTVCAQGGDVASCANTAIGQVEGDVVALAHTVADQLAEDAVTFVEQNDVEIAETLLNL